MKLTSRSSWNPPDIPLSVLASTDFRDLNGEKFKPSRRAAIYRFPWYLSFLYLWHGFKHWYKSGQWPEKILYFSDGQHQDRDIFLDVIKHPQDFYSCDQDAYCDPSRWEAEEDVELDELFDETADS